MDLQTLQTAQGAVFAPDSIPLHFGDQAAEYHAALEAAVLLDRSHEARLVMAGSTAIDLLHRISTNDLNAMPIGIGRPTVLVNANARILDRIDVFRRGSDLLVLGEPGRSNPLRNYLQRNIFFGDDARLQDLSTETRQFDLHGPQAGAVISRAAPEAAGSEVLQGCAAVIAGAEVYIARRKPVNGQRWTVIVPIEHAPGVWSVLAEVGARPAGSLIYNVLRVRAGLPSVGRELSEQFIPLEVGLWDEVSFAKGCYTGQEIIARMESRNRLAKTIVMLQPAAAVSVPASIYAGGRQIGQLTSSVAAPDGELFAIGVVKPDFAEPGQRLEIGDNRVSAQVKALPEGSRREIR
jgi:folate-binding protein YgfZ